MTTYDYRLLNTMETGVLGAAVNGIFQLWMDEWFARPLSDVDVTVTVNHALSSKEALRSSRWQLYRSVSTAWVAVHRTDALQIALCKALTKGLVAADCGDLRSPIASKLFGRVEADMAARFLRPSGHLENAGLAEDTLGKLPDLVYQPGSGCALVEISVRGAAISWMMGPNSVEGWLKPSEREPKQEGQAVTSARSALAAQPVSLQVTVGTAELSLSQLESLSRGDVIRLDRQVDEPLPLLVDDQGYGIGGYLGASGNKRAVQLTTWNSE